MRSINDESIYRLDSVFFVFFAICGVTLLISALSHGRIDQIFYAAGCSTLALGFLIDRTKYKKRADR